MSDAGVRARARRLMTRALLRGVHFGSRYRRLELLYWIRDPWDLDSDRQRVRFHEINRLIEENFGHVGRVLEIGCGEGHQSQELLRVCDELVGTDVSTKAVRRARARCPQATFVVGDVFGGTKLQSPRADLVLACEVLYYVRDVRAAIARLSQLGDACLVTYYDRPAEELDPVVRAVPGAIVSRVENGGAGWTVVWWRNAPSTTT
jgi:SAM-dependent methyltransferase